MIKTRVHLVVIIYKNDVSLPVLELLHKTSRMMFLSSNEDFVYMSCFTFTLISVGTVGWPILLFAQHTSLPQDGLTFVPTIGLWFSLRVLVHLSVS